jgi:hypothetical protein
VQGKLTTLTRDSEQAALMSNTKMLILVLEKKLAVTGHIVYITVLVFFHGAKNLLHNNVP